MYLKTDIEKILEKIVVNNIREYIKIKKQCDVSIDRIGPFAHYGSKISAMELFSRTALGIIFIMHKDEKSEYVDFFNHEILKGLISSSKEYWGDIDKIDQRVVEMPPIILMFLFHKDLTWDTYSAEEKENILCWFRKINNFSIQKNNWIFFKIIVNEVIKTLTGSEINIEKEYKIIESLYIKDGWYKDGKSGRIDYYNSFAFHYYGLILSKFVENKYTENYRCRALEFGKSFIYWFSEIGDSVPFGRSLTYRMACASFWSACVFADVFPFDLKVIKGIIYRNIAWWINQNIFRENGILSVGYCYPNILMSEDYNAYGSPGWALKIFIFLLIREDKKFWRCKEEILPTLTSKILMKNENMVICRNGINHVMLFNNNNCYGDFIDHFEAKYMKFVYSNMFGFSVQRNECVYEKGGFDSVISISTDGKRFYPRNNVIWSKSSEKLLVSEWCPIEGVCINSIIVVGIPWHIRIHRIKTDTEIIVNDAGFSIPSDSLVEINKKTIKVMGDCICSGAALYDGNARLKLANNSPGTNLIFPHTKMPYINWNLKPGKHCLISAFFGATARKEMEMFDEVPFIFLHNHSVDIKLYEQDVKIELNGYKVPYKKRIESFIRDCASKLKSRMK